MKLAKVIGTVVCTRKDEAWEGVKLLLLQPVDEAGAQRGEPLVACDVVQAGPDDAVLYEEGREAALCLKNWFNLADACVMGIVDQVNRVGPP